MGVFIFGVVAVMIHDMLQKCFHCFIVSDFFKQSAQYDRLHIQIIPYAILPIDYALRSFELNVSSFCGIFDHDSFYQAQSKSLRAGILDEDEVIPRDMLYLVAYFLSIF